MLVCDRKLHIAALKFAKATTYCSKIPYDSQINLKQVNRQFQALAIVFLPFYSFYQPILVALLIYSIFLIVLYREGLPSWYIWSVHYDSFICIACTSTAICNIDCSTGHALYLKSRSADRNIIISSFFLAIISCFIGQTYFKIFF
jgi:rod shape determining protein RodA